MNLNLFSFKMSGGIFKFLYRNREKELRRRAISEEDFHWPRGLPSEVDDESKQETAKNTSTVNKNMYQNPTHSQLPPTGDAQCGANPLYPFLNINQNHNLQNDGLNLSLSEKIRRHSQSQSAGAIPKRASQISTSHFDNNNAGAFFTGNNMATGAFSTDGAMAMGAISAGGVHATNFAENGGVAAKNMTSNFMGTDGAMGPHFPTSGATAAVFSATSGATATNLPATSGAMAANFPTTTGAMAGNFPGTNGATAAVFSASNNVTKGNFPAANGDTAMAFPMTGVTGERASERTSEAGVATATITGHPTTMADGAPFNNQRRASENDLTQKAPKAKGFFDSKITEPIRRAFSTSKLTSTSSEKALEAVKSTPKKFTVRGNSVFNSHLLFSELNDDTYRVKSFKNRKAAKVPFGGYHSDDIYDFEKFNNGKEEVMNFFESGIGQMASKILPDGSYFIFGIRSYLRVVPCKNCFKGSCEVDHLLQAIVEDFESHQGVSRDVQAHDLILKRPFQYVRLTRPSPISQIIPRAGEEAKAYPLVFEKMTKQLFLDLSRKYFGNGEIAVDDNNNFVFRLTPNTSSDSCIATIILVKDLLEKGQFEDSLAALLSANEPRARETESLEAVVFALYVFYLSLTLAFESPLDSIFKDIRIDDLGLDSFGKLKEGALPFGLVYAISRLEIEHMINIRCYEIATQGDKSKFSVTAKGNVFLKSHPNDKLRLVLSPYFPHISDEFPVSIFGLFVALLSFRIIDFDAAVRCGISNSEGQRLTAIIDQEEMPMLEDIDAPPTSHVESAPRGFSKMAAPSTAHEGNTSRGLATMAADVQHEAGARGSDGMAMRNVHDWTVGSTVMSLDDDGDDDGNDVGQKQKSVDRERKGNFYRRAGDFVSLAARFRWESRQSMLI